VISVLVGSGISLLFELALVFMPAQRSQISDLLLNILGTLIGILLYGRLLLHFKDKPGLSGLFLTKNNHQTDTGVIS
jgi:glycopeptide antibiotics resistance protein